MNRRLFEDLIVSAPVARGLSRRARLLPLSVAAHGAAIGVALLGSTLTPAAPGGRGAAAQAPRLGAPPGPATSRTDPTACPRPGTIRRPLPFARSGPCGRGCAGSAGHLLGASGPAPRYRRSAAMLLGLRR